MNTKNKLKNISKSQKPIDFDIHLKYLCQNCDQVHWLSFKEASTKNYKLVCDCDNVFKVKRVKSFEIKFHKKRLNITPVKTETQPSSVQQNLFQIDRQLLDRSAKLLISYGFTKDEAIRLIEMSYNKNPVNDFSSLVKQTLSDLRGN